MPTEDGTQESESEPLTDPERSWRRLMDRFGYTCPECGAPEGMCGTVSCSECGYIPEEVRA